jgi:hypothetical protein
MKIETMKKKKKETMMVNVLELFVAVVLVLAVVVLTEPVEVVVPMKNILIPMITMVRVSMKILIQRNEIPLNVSKLSVQKMQTL